MMVMPAAHLVAVVARMGLGCEAHAQDGTERERGDGGLHATDSP